MRGAPAWGGPPARFADDKSEFQPRLRWHSHPSADGRAAVELLGVDRKTLQLLLRGRLTDEQWHSFLVVCVARDDRATKGARPRVPIWGAYSVAEGAIRFEPRFRLDPGQRYRAEFDPARLREVIRTLPGGAAHAAEASGAESAAVVADYVEPSRLRRPATKVTAVYPSGATLPENLLRFYIHFSAPMSRGEAYHRVHLLDAAGKPIDFPFLELAEELWSSDGTRFTLLFEPGRIKRGLKPREEAGPILQAGRSYCLVIDREWLDAEGNPLKSSSRKAFQAGPPDSTSPDPATWRIVPPRMGSREPLEVRFPGSLDHALLERLLTVRDRAGKVVAGEVSVRDGEAVWSLTPQGRWEAGEYRLEVDTDLEDPAGNSIARPFEVDVSHPITRRVAQKTVALPFRVLGVR
jgi:hypothetical protein